MFITVTYRDVPELSGRRKSTETDLAIERNLLVNPDCPVRIMLEYIRNRCKLGIFTTFDLCDENGTLKRLFNMPTYEYATDLFEHKRNYYIVVFKMENDRRLSVLPQLNWDSRLYQELKAKILKFMTPGDPSVASDKPEKEKKVSPSPRSPPLPKAVKGKK